MLAYVLLGIGLIVLVYVLVGRFLAADPRALAGALRGVGVGLGVAFLALLAVRGHIGTAAAIAAVALPLYRHLRVQRNRAKAAQGPGAGQTSAVETLYLRMTLDHDSGAMSGEVRHGPFKGRPLAGLSLDELRALMDECLREDEPSASVLEAWLDREHPDWRAAPGPEEPPPSRAATMTREEAYDILGLPTGATEEQVREAHRRLMMKVHPDLGGSTYLAAKLNQAKDLLLRT